MALDMAALPVEVLGEVMRRVDQDARVACFTACKALKSAATLPNVWETLHFTELDHTAVAFLLEHPCHTVVIRNDRPDDIAWFLDILADRGASDMIRKLRIEMGAVKRVPSELFVALGRHSGLQSLIVDVQSVEKTCEVLFENDHCLQRLETLAVREGSELTKQLVVWFNGNHSSFAALWKLELVVGMSDIMTSLDKMPGLRELVYRCDEDEGGETYEDVNMAGATLNALEIDVGVYTDTRRLFRHMCRATIKKLTLHMNDDYFEISRPLSPAMEELYISVCVDQADLELDFCCLRDDHPDLKHINVHVGLPWQHELGLCEHTVTFRHVPAFNEWLTYATPRLSAHDAARVVVSPA
jgi:hypothetical protein